MLPIVVTHRTLLKLFLAIALVVAGLVAGMRFVSPATDNVADLSALDINLTGEWIGITTEDYGDEARYDYRLVLEQEGNQLTGMMYLLRNHDRVIYTETIISGTIEGATAFYQADEILSIENAQRQELCLVETTVSFERADGHEMLSGTWNAQENQQPACDTITGHVILTRQS